MALTSAIVIGAGIGISTQAQKKAGQAQQQLNNFNAKVNEVKADDAIARGLDTEMIQRTNTRRLIGQQKVAFGAGGAVVDQKGGVADNAFADTAYMSELDALNIRTNAAREAWGYKTGAAEDIYKGQLAEMDSKARQTQTILNAGGSFLAQRYGFTKTPTKVVT